LPIEVAGKTTFFVVLESETNLWDCCTDLPNWIWNEQKFEFMLSFEVTTEDGQIYNCNDSGQYASQLIEF
jgi:hypothetical protein